MPTYQLRVNGESRSVDVRDPDEPLLYVLRNQLRLTGAKFGCGLAQGGACTVLVYAQPTRSCTLPVSRVGSADVTTIEGVGSADKPHPVHAAFIPEHAAQGGYFTNGLVVTSVARAKRNPDAALRH